MRPRPAWVAPAATALGFALFVPVGILYLASGLVVPQPWLSGLWGVGGALLAYAVAHRRRPAIVLAAPLAATLVWVASVSLGGTLLSWTA